jgi:hypothetical protein
VAEDACRRSNAQNALNTDDFPSLRSLQQDVVDIVAGWLNGGPGTPRASWPAGEPRASCSRSKERAAAAGTPRPGSSGRSSSLVWATVVSSACSTQA